jgi:hypothetical protein
MKIKHLPSFFVLTISLLWFSIPLLGQAQDSIGIQNILLVEKTAKHLQPDTLPGGTIKAVHQRYFKKGDRVAVIKYDVKKMQTGKIKSITDSSIFLKGEEINITNIKRISPYRGVEISLAGASTAGLGITLFGLFGAFYTPKYDEDGDEYTKYGLFNRQIVSLLVTFAGCMVSVVGIIQVATVKHYRMDKGYTLWVGTKKKKSSVPVQPFL